MSVTQFSPEQVAEMVIEKLADTNKNLAHLNVMVMGKTGVGKSTLLNSVFTKPLAETGIGKPVTQGIREYTLDDYPLSIFDTPGLELDGENAVDELLNNVFDIIDERNKTLDINKTIHVIWYCINPGSSRFEPAEIDFLKKFTGVTSKYKVPVIVVLTKSVSKPYAKSMKEIVEKEGLPIAQVVPVLAQDYVMDEEYTARAYGLDILLEVTHNVIPEAVRNTLLAVQKADIKMKVRKAQLVVSGAVAGAAATGASPIPFSDAALLVPDQIGMIAGITAFFGLPIEKSTITALVSSTLGSAGATVLGKTVVTGILKCIPGVGTVVGAIISGSTAAVITAALGEAYIGIMLLIAKGEMKVSDLETNEGKEMMSRMFKQKLGLKRDNDAKPLE